MLFQHYDQLSSPGGMVAEMGRPREAIAENCPLSSETGPPADPLPRVAKPEYCPRGGPSSCAANLEVGLSPREAGTPVDPRPRM